jgi:hypothetical protein
MRLVKIFVLIISVLSAFIVSLALGLKLFYQIKMSGTFYVIASAQAQQTAMETKPMAPTIAGMIPWILAGVFVIMILAFSVSVVTLLVVQNSEANEKRLTAADNIVKTFGGFFIGFATSLLNIGHP